MIEQLEQFATIYPTLFLSDFLRYFLAAAPLALLLYWVRPSRLMRRRLQPRRQTRAAMRREVRYSLITAAIFALNGYGVWVGIQYGILKMYQAPDDFGWLWLVLSLPAIVIVHDTYFYWTHRAMHHRRLFRYFHRGHHRSHTPTPWAAYAFDPAEAWVQALFLPLYLLLVPTHAGVVAAFLIFMIVRNVMGHAGFELHPQWWLDNPLTRFHNTTAHHDLHHETGRWNFGLYFTWWDRLMGTEHPDYRQRFKAAWQGEMSKRRATSTAGVGVAVVLASAAVFSGDTHATEVDDVWITPGVGSMVNITPCKGDPEALCGEVIWLLDAADADGAPKVDRKNRDPGLRDRTLVGTSLLSGFERGAEPLEGRIYNPEDGRTYRATIELLNENVLEVRGCVLMFCDSQIWHRAHPALAGAVQALEQL